MQLNLSVKEIRALDMKPIKERLIDGREKIRIFERHEDQYRLLKHLGWQFHNVTILDLGTRRGTSAVCLADNPCNRVITFDIISESKGHQLKDLFVYCPNVEFRQMSIHDIPDELILSSPLIYLDIDHSGNSEDIFFKHLNDIGYNGFLFADDVDFPRKFPGLQRVWNKHGGTLLPRGISHDTGTGLMVFGENSVNVVE